MKEVDSLRLNDVIHKAIITERGSSKMRAADMGMSQGVFLIKGNPHREDCFFSPDQLLHLIMNGYPEILTEMARQAGYVLQKVDCCNEDLLMVHMNSVAEHADVSQAARDAFADRKVEPHEAAAMLKEKLEARAADDLEIAMLNKIIASGKTQNL